MKNKILLVIILVSIAITAGIIWNVSQDRAYASVTVGNEYNATTTDANWNAQVCKPVLTGYKTLGSVIVTLTSNAPLEIYDATTTSNHSDHATTSIALWKTTTVGTYTFDVQAKRGICVVGASTVGVASTTITTR
jgi:hypothetical protein